MLPYVLRLVDIAIDGTCLGLLVYVARFCVRQAQLGAEVSDRLKRLEAVTPATPVIDYLKSRLPTA